MSLARILLVIALFYLLYTVFNRYFRFASSSKKQQQFNRSHSATKKPEGQITVEKPKNGDALKDDDFVDYEEIK